MIEKNSIEFKLWADAYKLKAELSPPPCPVTNEYWQMVREKTAAGYDVYRQTPCKVLAEHLYLGIILQLEQESLTQKGADNGIQ